LYQIWRRLIPPCTNRVGAFPPERVFVQRFASTAANSLARCPAALKAHHREADWPGSNKESVVSRDERQHPPGRGDSAHIKGAIGAGRTRDKVPNFDPGAAPLGSL
jgi:hypothetical protein